MRTSPAEKDNKILQVIFFLCDKVITCGDTGLRSVTNQKAKYRWSILGGGCLQESGLIYWKTDLPQLNVS